VTAAPPKAIRDVTDEHPPRPELVAGGAVLRWPDHPLAGGGGHEVADCGHAIKSRAADLAHSEPNRQRFRLRRTLTLYRVTMTG
jgi:hypothetical protein